MFVVTLASVLLIVVTTLIHYEVLGTLSTRLPRLAISGRIKLVLVVFAALAAHVAEMAVYGGVLFLAIRNLDVGTLNGLSGSSLLENTLYFSAETYTSLGFGDIAPLGPVRLLAGVEALNGLLLIGWSASFLYLAMERYWDAPRNGADRAPPSREG